jgi:hypothetical protein
MNSEYLCRMNNAHAEQVVPAGSDIIPGAAP